MHIIARPILRRFARSHAEARNRLEAWWAVASQARWTNLADVRCTYGSADQVGGCLVFNCQGTNYRLIVRVSYANEHTRGTLFVKYFLSHAEYSKNRWKGCCT